MAAWTLTLTGAKELTANLRALPAALTQAVLRDALIAAAQPMTTRMGELAPHGPRAPHLADSMTVTPGKSDEQSAEVKVGPAKDFFYGRFWEFGTRYMSARPFMRPAFDEQSDPALVILANRLWVVIARQAEAGAARGPK